MVHVERGSHLEYKYPIAVAIPIPFGVVEDMGFLIWDGRPGDWDRDTPTGIVPFRKHWPAELLHVHRHPTNGRKVSQREFSVGCTCRRYIVAFCSNRLSFVVDASNVP